jgi:hypothetical protein
MNICVDMDERALMYAHVQRHMEQCSQDTRAVCLPRAPRLHILCLRFSSPEPYQQAGCTDGVHHSGRLDAHSQVCRSEVTQGIIYTKLYQMRA